MIDADDIDGAAVRADKKSRTTAIAILRIAV